MMKEAWRSGLIFCVAMLAAVSEGAEAHVRNNQVFVNNVPVLTWKSTIHSITPERRAEAIAEKLRLVNEDDPVSVLVNGSLALIKIGSTASIEVPDAEAGMHLIGKKDLANQWASAIRDALFLPPLKFPEDSLRLPVGSSKTFRLVGSQANGAKLSSTDDQVVKVSKSDDLVVLQCLSAGDAIIRADSGMSVRSLHVFVRPTAANFPQTISLDLSGAPVTSTYLHDSIEGAVRTKLVRLYGADVKVNHFTADALGQSGSKKLTVWVRVHAPDAFDGAGPVEVTVHNIPHGLTKISKLWYSNAPESVKQVGNLFAATLPNSDCVRFLYHHTNAANQPFIFRAEVINDSDRDSRIWITEAECRPDKNPVAAGMKAARQYFKNHQYENAELVTIPAHSAIPISFHRILPQETISGLCELGGMDGNPELLVRADVLPPFDLNNAWYNATFSSSPWRESGVHSIDDYDRASYERSEHIYPNPSKEEELAYEVGGRFGVLLIGQKPIAGEDHTNNLDGNYGVLHTIHVTLKNPTDQAADAAMTFESSSGYTSGVFSGPSGLAEVPFLGSKAVSRVLAVHLKPHESLKFDLTTMPISGGAYPITLTIRPSASNK